MRREKRYGAIGEGAWARLRDSRPDRSRRAERANVRNANSPPLRGDALERTLLDRFATRVEEIRFGPWLVVWWTYRASHAELPDDDPRDSQEILNALMARHAAGSEDERRLRLALSGVIVAANSDARRWGDTGAGSLHARFRGRFAKARNAPAAMLVDTEFDVWLRKRAIELAR